MILLIKESYHSYAPNNHGALYHVREEFDECGKSEGMVADFMGNVVCPDLSSYLAENPVIQVADRLPEGAVTR